MFIKRWPSAGRLALFILAAGLSSLLGILAFPPYKYPFLIFITVVPLFIYLEREPSLLKNFLLFYLYGFVFLSGTLIWVNQWGWWCPFAVALLCALPFGLTGVGTRVLLDGFGPLPAALLTPLLFAGIDYIKTLGFWAFPFSLFAYSQTESLSFIQSASVFGMWGLIFIIVLVNFAFAASFFSRLNVANRVIILLFAIALLELNGLLGNLALEKNTLVDGNLPKLRVGVVQGGLGSWTEWKGDFIRRSYNTYLSGTTQGGFKKGSPKPDLIFWPETAFPAFINGSETYTYTVDLLRFASLRETRLIIGALYGEDGKEYNSAVYIGPGFGPDRIYRKLKLVPFGEVVPFSGVVRLLNYPWGSRDLSATRSLLPLHTDKAKVGIGICYESPFPSNFRYQTLQGADLLALLANNSWFTNDAGSVQHSSMDILRAVENRRFYIRCSTTGVSQIVDPYGRRLQASAMNRGAYLQEEVKLLRSLSFYTKYEPIIVTTMMAILFIAFCCIIIKERYMFLANKRMVE